MDYYYLEPLIYLKSCFQRYVKKVNLRIQSRESTDQDNTDGKIQIRINSRIALFTYCHGMDYYYEKTRRSD